MTTPRWLSNVGLLLITMPALAQFPSNTQIALFSADALIRSMDAHITEQQLHDSCQCFYERNIPKIATSTAGMWTYSLGIAGLNVYASYQLTKHHHDKLAKALVITDIAYDGHSVLSDYRQPRITLAPRIAKGILK